MAVATLKLEGRLDTAAVANVELGFTARAGALTNPDDRAIIDLADLTFISSMGIRLLVSTLKQFKQRGTPFATLRPHSAAVNELLRMADLTGHLNMVDSRAAADAMLAGSQ